MGLVRSAVRPLARAAAGPLSGIATPEKWVVDWMQGGAANSSGVRVDYDTALLYGPFFAGVRVIAEDVSTLPFPLYERLARGRERATWHPVYRLLTQTPNPMMSASQLRETLTGHALTWGNGVAELVLNKNTGDIEEIWPLRPDRLTIKPTYSAGGRLQRWYIYDDQVNGITTILPAERVLHIAGLGWDGVRGYSVVEHAANSIGLGLATEHHGAKVFSNSSAPGGALSHPGILSPEARKRMQVDWENIHRSIDNAHRVAILEEGVTWQQVGMRNDEAQFLETRKLQVTEIARWLRLPSHKINDLERATFSNIEQQQLDYLNSALRAWLVRWEDAVLTQLLLPEERATLYAEHLVDAILRGDIAARYAAYAVGRQWGWLSANDVRERENLNPVDGGDQYLVPLNMVPAGQPAAWPAGNEDEDEPERAAAALRYARALRGRGTEVRRRIADQYAEKIAEADRAIAEAEQRAVEKLVAEHLDDDARGRSRGQRGLVAFLAAVRERFEGTILEQLTETWMPIFLAFAGDIAEDAAEDVGHEDEVDLSTWARAYVTAHAAYQVASAIGQLRRIAEDAETNQDAADAVRARLAKWVEERPERVARWESTQMSNAAARETWKEAGVQRLQWVTVGKTCPFCQKLDGTIVDINEPFVPAGGEVTGLEEKLQVDRKITHPPLHPGCDCRLVTA